MPPTKVETTVTLASGMAIQANVGATVAPKSGIPDNGSAPMRLALGLACVLLLAGSAGGSGAAQLPGATASAFGIKVLVPGQAGGSSTSASAPPSAVAT